MVVVGAYVLLEFFEEFFGEGLEREYKKMGLGSGVIIDKEGHILTNEHVIAGASEIKVKLSSSWFFHQIQSMGHLSEN